MIEWRQFAAGLLSATLGFGAAGEAPLGSLNAYGLVKLGSMDVPSGASVFDGQIVSTGRSGKALLALRDQTRVALGHATRARVSRKSVVLEEGAAQFTSVTPSGTPIFAGALRLEPVSPSASLEASILERGRVNVAVWTGNVRVLDPSGAAVGRLRAGQALVFGLAALGEKAAPAPVQEGTTIQTEGRSGGQAPGVIDTTPEKKKNRTALYVLIGVGAAGGAAGAALSGNKRGS